RAGEQGGALTASVSQPDGTERSVAVRVHSHSATGEQVLELDGHLVRCIIAAVGDYEWWVKLGDTTHVLRWHSPLPEPSERGPRAGSLVAPMPGQVVDVLVAEGQAVQAGDALLILEAMKMEHMIVASHAGIVASIHFHAGESVPAGAILLDLTPG
ncbi:MAG TPA: biotin/lipoyl-containing protein, partial [Ktedonobacterales bacterium]|nr:biotin/lipoyl-containing protein [Ktedonobacterales bacterium]